MRRLALLLIVAACACAPDRERASTAWVQERADWSALLDSLPRDPAVAAAALEAYRARNGLPISFFFPEDPPAALAKLRAEDHPCGQTVTVFARSIPQSVPGLDAELVLEIDARGKVLRRWRIPADLTVAGVRGDRLLVNAYIVPGNDSDAPFLLAVAPSGAYHVVPRGAEPAPASIPCPPLADFGDSVYLGCWRFADGGRARSIAYQSPCT